MSLHHEPHYNINIEALSKRMMKVDILKQSSNIELFNYCLKKFKWIKRVELLNEENQDSSLIKLEFLKWIQSKLKRTRCYYIILNTLERKILELCIHLAHKGLAKLKSILLLNVIGGIIKKVGHILESFKERMINVGRPIVEKICEIAYLWGNKEAVKWKNDLSFSFYWGLLKTNNPIKIF